MPRTRLGIYYDNLTKKYPCYGLMYNIILVYNIIVIVKCKNKEMIDHGLDYRPPGNPTRLAPIPNPAPDRVVTPTLGIYVSRILNVAAAVKASNPISAIFSDRFGIA